MLFSLFTVLFALITSIHAVPLASPETRGASGECSPPEVEILSTEKQKQGPYLVSGARSDANPRGGVASFGNLWSVTYTYQYGGGLDISKEFGSIFKKVSAGLDFEFSYSVGKATAFNTITACPPNDLYDYTITWGLQDYRYVWYIKGNLKYYDPKDPLMRCSGDRIKYKGQTVPFELYVPATQAGAKDDAAAEVQFQCCTDSRAGTFPGSPVCPNAS